MKKIILFLLLFCLTFSSVLGVSAADNEVTLGKFTFGDGLVSVTGSSMGSIKSFAEDYNRPYIVHFYTGSGSHLLYFSPVRLYYDGSLISTGSGEVTVFEYNGYYWKIKTTQNLTEGTSISGTAGSSSYKWATFDIYGASNNLILDGDENFLVPPRPLAEVVLMGSEEALQMMGRTLGGTATTLVLCGVGCLTLLVALKLFGKRSLIFPR